MRALLAAIERRHRSAGFDRGSVSPRSATARDWTFGAPEIDGWLPDWRLDAASLSEIKPETYGDGPAALAFALLLAARRLGAGCAGPVPPGLMVWCWPTRAARETGGLYGPGLASFGLDPARVLLVETATAAETLWAMEESLGSGAAAMVVGCLDAVDLTPARRLALAAQGQRAPALLVTAARSEVTPATFARWRVAVRPSAPHVFDPAAPGEPRFAVTLDRCRGTVADVAPPSYTVEWNHGAHRFGVVAGMADRAPEAASRA